MFDNFDENQDGILDLGEFKKLLEFMGFQISDSRIRRVLYFFRDDQSY